MGHIKKKLLIKHAEYLEGKVRRERSRSTKPGGLFGTYWDKGFAGREDERIAASRRWEDMMVQAEHLRQEAEREA